MKTEEKSRTSVMRTDAEKMELLDKVCELMYSGTAAIAACKEVGIPQATFFDFVRKNPEAKEKYMFAREMLIEILAEDVYTEPYKTPHWIDEHGNKRYDNAAVNLTRLCVDSKKWTLARISQKYNDRIVNEHVGANGGPITMAAIDLTRLESSEIDNLDAIMTKLLTQTAQGG